MYISLKLSKLLMFSCLVIVMFFVICTAVFQTTTPVSMQAQPVKLAVIMYHGLIDDTSKQNQYFIDTKYFEEDLKYITSKGYHTIFASDLTDYFEKGTPLPENPIMLTFDDGYYNNYAFAFPLLKKYNCKAVISPIGIAADQAENDTKQNTFYSQCKWSQLKEMQDSGLVEIQNHTYNLHHIDNGRSGAKNNPDEDFNAYKAMLTADLEQFNTRMYDELGTYPNSIVFPFGSFSSDTLTIVKEMNFKAAFDCEEKLNFLSSKDDLFRIHRFLRPNNMSSNNFFENIYKESGV